MRKGWVFFSLAILTSGLLWVNYKTSKPPTSIAPVLSATPLKVRVETNRETRVELGDIAVLTAPIGAFIEPTNVTLRVTQSKDIAERFEQTGGTLAPAGTRRAPWELVITLGKANPKKPLVLEMLVPDDLLKANTKGRIDAFVQEVSGSGNELHVAFLAVDGRFDVASQKILIELNSADFTNIDNASGNQEAVVILASIAEVGSQPNVNPSPSPK